MSDPWAALRRWARDWAPQLAAGLRRPVEEAVLADAARRLGPLPESMLAVYRVHDGEAEHRRAGVLGGLRLLPLAEVVQLSVVLRAAPWAEVAVPVARADGDVFVVLRREVDGHAVGELALASRDEPGVLGFRAEGLAACIEGLGARAQRWEVTYRPVWGGLEVLDEPRPDMALAGLLGEQLDLEVEYAQEAMDMVGLCAIDFVGMGPIGWPELGTLSWDGIRLRVLDAEGSTDWIDETADAFGAPRANLHLAASLVGRHASLARLDGRHFALPRVGRLAPDGLVTMSENAATSLSKVAGAG